jgi:hypothetical protein
MKYCTSLLVALLLPPITPVYAATFTVGVHGTYSSIQSAIDAALATGGSNEVHIETGDYYTNVSFGLANGDLVLSGGWDSVFAARAPNLWPTLFSGDSTNSVLIADVSGGSLTLDGLSITGGGMAECGGGARLLIQNDGVAEIRDSRFYFNRLDANGKNDFRGAGICAIVQGDAGLTLDHNTIHANQLSTESGTTLGGGVYIEASGSSLVSIEGNSIQGNSAGNVLDLGNASGGGLYVYMSGAAQVSLSENLVQANALPVFTNSQASGSGAFFRGENCGGNCALSITRSKFDRNSGGLSAQLAVSIDEASLSSTVYVANVLLRMGSGGGIFVEANSGTANFVNLTVADNTGTGILAAGSSSIGIFNTIAYSNGLDFAQTGGFVGLGNNLFGVDPGFVDAANGDYHLIGSSPARDAGASAPPGGVGDFDLDGSPRVFGAAPDIGAYEIGDVIFLQGFES